MTLPSSIVSTSHEVLINFKSDNHDSFPGFNASYSVLCLTFWSPHLVHWIKLTILLCLNYQALLPGDHRQAVRMQRVDQTGFVWIYPDFAKLSFSIPHQHQLHLEILLRIRHRYSNFVFRIFNWTTGSNFGKFHLKNCPFSTRWLN